VVDDKSIQAVIFDRDGVLTYFDTDSLSDYLRPLLPISPFQLMHDWEQWGEEVGFPRSVPEERLFLESFWNHVGLLYELTQQQTAELHQLEYTNYIRAFPDAPMAILTARRCGMKVGVLSNFSLASLDASLVAAGFGENIDVACAATVIGASKPMLDAYLIVARLLHVSPENCLFLDDEPMCVAGARSAGMQAYLVDRLSKSRDGKEFSTSVLPDLTSLAGILGCNRP